MTLLTHKQITDITGPLDEELIVRIIDSGARLEEVTEAHGWFVDSRAMGKARHRRPAGKVLEVCEILETGWVPREPD
jgi:hypothetical protein